MVVAGRLWMRRKRFEHFDHAASLGVVARRPGRELGGAGNQSWEGGCRHSLAECEMRNDDFKAWHGTGATSGARKCLGLARRFMGMIPDACIDLRLSRPQMEFVN